MSSSMLLRAIGLVPGDLSRRIARKARNGRERWKRERKSGMAKMRRNRKRNAR